MTTIERMARAAWDRNREICAAAGLGPLPAWEEENEQLRADWIAFMRSGVEAMRYVDGEDEEAAIAAGAAIKVDAVLAIEAFDAWISTVLGEKK